MAWKTQPIYGKLSIAQILKVLTGHITIDGWMKEITWSCRMDTTRVCLSGKLHVVLNMKIWESDPGCFMTAAVSEDNKITTKGLKVLHHLAFLPLEQNPNQIYPIAQMEKMKTKKRC